MSSIKLSILPSSSSISILPSSFNKFSLLFSINSFISSHNSFIFFLPFLGDFLLIFNPQSLAIPTNSDLEYSFGHFLSNLQPSSATGGPSSATGGGSSAAGRGRFFSILFIAVIV